MDAKELGAQAWNEQTIRMSMAENILCAVLKHPHMNIGGRAIKPSRDAVELARVATTLADALLEELADD